MPLWEERPDAWHEISPGVRRRVLAHDEKLTMVLYDMAPSTTLAVHRHPHVQAGVVFEGGGTFTVGGVALPLHKGTSYVVPSGVPHELKTQEVGRTVILDVFTPRRDDFSGEALPPDRP
jgi:quercetin dioxygenase-like cupin family protein